jgi:hypothetical protein
VPESAWSRRFRDIVDGLTVEFDITTESNAGFARRIAGLSLDCEVIEAKLAAGEPADTAKLVTMANAIRRLRNELARSHRAKRRAARIGA